MKVEVNKLLSAVDLCQIFSRNQMTIWLWRNKHDLPCIEVAGGKQPAIRFIPEQVLDWAQKHEKVVHDPGPLHERGIKVPSALLLSRRRALLV